MKLAKVLAIVAMGGLVLMALVLAAGVLAFRSCVAAPANVTVSAAAPLHVAQGSRFEIVATVKNQSATPRTVVDIDVADEYLKGIAIERSLPPYVGSEHIPVDDTISHHFNLPLPANGALEVRFIAYAAHTGDYAGDFDFCIDRDTTCSSFHVRTIVGP
jgi:hypothetical protein